MTRYEEMVKSGELPPMNGLEWLLLGFNCDCLLDGKFNDQPEEKEFAKETIKLMWIEVDHLYRDEPEMLEKLKEVVNK